MEDKPVYFRLTIEGDILPQFIENIAHRAVQLTPEGGSIVLTVGLERGER